MAEGLSKSVFVVTACTHVRYILDDLPALRTMLLRYISRVADCRESIQREECVLLIVDLDGTAAEGLQLLGDVESGAAQVPRLALVRRGDIPMAVHGIHVGAANCLEKPIDRNLMSQEVSVLPRATKPCVDHMRSRLAPMKTKVLSCLLEGQTNHRMAKALHRSPRTIELRRRHIMRKLRASGIVDLVKTAVSMDVLGRGAREWPNPARFNGARGGW